MTSLQRAAFRAGEADRYFDRNPKSADPDADPVIAALRVLRPKPPQRILEIGCGAGLVLDCLAREFGARCAGIEPSAKAVEYGRGAFPRLQLDIGTADALPYDDGAFDFVLFGGVLVWCDPDDYFRIACEADRVLADGGLLVLKELNSPAPYRNAYHHREGLSTRKMDWPRMFTWHPAYRLVSRLHVEPGKERPDFRRDDTLAIDVLHKSLADGFPDGPRR
jgi:ubiquinone/menaquinone biosynthesis C-methylase UbiE